MSQSSSAGSKSQNDPMKNLSRRIDSVDESDLAALPHIRPHVFLLFAGVVDPDFRLEIGPRAPRHGMSVSCS